MTAILKQAILIAAFAGFAGSAFGQNDAGSPSAGGSVAADLGAPMSNDERIQLQTKHLEKYSDATELHVGDMAALKAAYVKIRKSGVDISPEDFLALRVALIDLSSKAPNTGFQPTVLNQALITPGTEVSPATLNDVSSTALASAGSPVNALSLVFNVDKKAAKEIFSSAKTSVNASAKKAKGKKSSK